MMAAGEAKKITVDRLWGC